MCANWGLRGGNGFIWAPQAGRGGWGLRPAGGEPAA